MVSEFYSALQALTDCQVFNLHRAENKAPFVVFQIIAQTPNTRLCGHEETQDTTIQIDVYADTYDTCNEIYTQILPIAQHTGETIKLISRESRRDDYEDKENLYRITADFNINHRN